MLRRFYGHRSIDVTANNYVGFDATAAAMRVDAHILALRDALPDPAVQVRIGRRVAWLRFR